MLKKLINILAFLNPDCVPEEILLAAPANEDLDFLPNKDQYVPFPGEM